MRIEEHDQILRKKVPDSGPPTSSTRFGSFDLGGFSKHNV
jgi:hypothetical protein